ncbi:MAG: hypothetical protein GQ578_02470 [Desulfuromonadaceae bacterium]|nr:hypothetical protein [Desulfuromonadaceae bacterium]
MSDGTNRIQILFPLLLILLLWMLSACAPIIYTKSQLQGGLLSYYEALRMMSVEELEQEQAMLRVSLNHAEIPCDQLRLAMLLWMPEFRLNNDSETEQLLKDFFEKEKTPAIQDKQIAWLLADEVQWRKKIQSHQQTLKNQLKEERAISLNLLEQLTKAQSTLKQLKNIDKNINAREQEISTPSTDKIPHEPK